MDFKDPAQVEIKEEFDELDEDATDFDALELFENSRDPAQVKIERVCVCDELHEGAPDFERLKKVKSEFEHAEDDSFSDADIKQEIDVKCEELEVLLPKTEKEDDDSDSKDIDGTILDAPKRERKMCVCVSGDMNIYADSSAQHNIEEATDPALNTTSGPLSENDAKGPDHAEVLLKRKRISRAAGSSNAGSSSRGVSLATYERLLEKYARLEEEHLQYKQSSGEKIELLTEQLNYYRSKSTQTEPKEPPMITNMLLKT